MWVRTLDMTLVSLSKMLYFLLFTKGHKWVTARVEVDIAHEKAFGALQLPRLYTSQGAEKDYRNVIGPKTRPNFIELLSTKKLLSMKFLP